MTEQQHSITPPPEMVQQWIKTSGYKIVPEWLNDAIQKIVQYGADQELEACIDWISIWHGLEHPELLIELLRAARRPKPPSLKEQALLALSHLVKGADESMDTMEAAEYVRRALESIND